jgi:hypothetical protein
MRWALNGPHTVRIDSTIIFTQRFGTPLRPRS